jgi:hypothetical protein
MRAHEGKRGSRGVPWTVALIAIATVAVWSLMSWLLVGSACVNGNILSGSPAGAMCEVELANWHGGHPSTAEDNLLEHLKLASPALIVIAGVGISRFRGHERPFWIAALVATIVVALPVLGLAVLPHS